MFETNIQNNSALISLARAAEITGYHQDYLGQLCRLGKLPAKKVGRNWFTSEDALSNLQSGGLTTNSPSEDAQETAAPDQEEVREVTQVLKQLRENSSSETPQMTMAQPALEQTITVSQVEGLPIAIRTVTSRVHSANNVQSIATNMRIKALQREVEELRQMFTRLMAEVTRHSELLQGRNFADVWHKQDSLKYQFASNFDLAGTTVMKDGDNAEEADFTPIEMISKPRFTVMTWVSATAALLVLTLLVAGAVTGMLWGSPTTTQVVYYHTLSNIAQSNSFGPAVAGDSTTNFFFDQAQTLPTPPSGRTPVNVVQ